MDAQSDQKKNTRGVSLSQGLKLTIVRVLCGGVLGGFLACDALAHSLLIGDMRVNAPISAAERDKAKFNFLAAQARRNSVDSGQVQAARSIYLNTYKWSKRQLKVCFWNGTEEQQKDVIRVSDVWHQAVPTMRFNFGDGDQIRKCDLADLQPETMPDIRISLEEGRTEIYNQTDLDKTGGDWSYPGKSFSQDPMYPTTMNLVTSMELKRLNQRTDYLFNVRHEFGHALSLVHEHQREVCKGKFNIKAIAASQPNWTESYAAAQVEAMSDSSNLNRHFGSYDKQSIMQYNFLQAWYTPDEKNKVNPCRRENDVYDLSEGDKVVVAEMYQPELNLSPERQAFIARAAKGETGKPDSIKASDSSSQIANQSASIVRALQEFNPGVGKLNRITIQVYPHKVDRDVVLKVVANLGYPLTNGKGEKIVQVSAKTNETLLADPTSTLLYTSDVPEQEIRYVAQSLIRAGVKIRSVQPYRLTARNGFTERFNLIQIGADVADRNRLPLTLDSVFSSPLPIYAPNRLR